MTFAQIAEEADHLTLDEQEELLDLLKNRIHEKRRDDIAEGIQQARREHKEGKSQAYNADALRAELLA
ncbi:MAG: hypothetical protein HQL32_01905 [Planctomycetes bacterium]|nr:hypothetical protein [Planctomycetota bacterium]